MTDDDHYQPWLRNQPGRTGGLARPAPLPTVPARPTKDDGAPFPASEVPAPAPRATAETLSADELLARPIPLPTVATPMQTGTAKRWLGAARAGLDRFTNWTIRLGERADVPARIERLELPRRLSVAATAVRRTVSAGAARSGEAARTAMTAAERAGEAAAPKIRTAASQARDGLVRGASEAKSGFSAGATKAGEAARRLVEATPPLVLPGAGRTVPAGPPESQLEKLLAEEALAAEARPRTISKAGGGGLPLFADVRQDSGGPAIEDAALIGSGDEAATRPQPAGLAIDGVSNSGATSQPAATAAPRSFSGWWQHRASWAAGAIILALGGYAAGATWGNGVGRTTATEAVVRNYLMTHPEILPQAMEQLRRNEAAARVGTLGDTIGKPFSGAWAGAADGDVTLTVFTDYACTFCRASVPDIDRLLREDRRLKIVFRELPILSADSEAAARLALVAAQRGKYMAVHRALFAAGTPDRAARIAVAASAGLPDDAATLENAGINRELAANVAMARQLGFEGTPSWVVGTQVLSGAVGYDKLRAAIATARAAQ